MMHQWIDIRSYQVRPSVWVFAFLLLLFGGLSIFLLSHANKRYYQQPIGADIEARRNPYLAAQYFKRQLGSELELRRDFSFIEQELKPYHALIISNSRKPLNQKRIDALLTYVEQGGHLIINAVEEFDDDRGRSGAPILDELGARLYRYEGSVDTTIESYEESDDATDNSSNEYLSIFTFDGYDQATKVDFNRYWYLIDASGDAIFIGGTHDSDHIIQYSRGEGVITVLSDMEIWNNYSIDEADHAMFLQQLTENYSKVWVIYNPQVASLWQLLWHHASYLIVSLLVFLIVIIWFYQVKTGPVFGQFTNDSRKLLQHIRAAAEFKWHRCQPQLLLDQLRDELHNRIKQRALKFEKLSRQEQLDMLHKMTELPKSKIAQAIHHDYVDQALFIEQVSTLQKLRKHINRKVI